MVDARLFERTAVERYPEVPRPATVLGRLLATILVVVEKSCVEETYPTVPRFCCVEKSIAPFTVPLAICARILDVVETSELVVKYTRVDVVDIKERLLTYRCPKKLERPATVLGRLLATILLVVEKSCVEETYPELPRPVTVDTKLMDKGITTGTPFDKRLLKFRVPVL